jgi:hypothetical protein
MKGADSMKAISIMYSFILILLLLGIIVISCTTSTYTETKSPQTEPFIGTSPWEPTPGERAKFTYRYFPSSFVYFNIDRGIYFYLSEGKWVDSHSLPQTIPIERDDYVILKMMIDKPYTFHEDVVKKYPPPSQREESTVP